jgi:hypothetical protein
MKARPGVPAPKALEPHFTDCGRLHPQISSPQFHKISGFSWKIASNSPRGPGDCLCWQEKGSIPSLRGSLLPQAFGARRFLQQNLSVILNSAATQKQISEARIPAVRVGVSSASEECLLPEAGFTHSPCRLAGCVISLESHGASPGARLLWFSAHHRKQLLALATRTVLQNRPPAFCGSTQARGVVASERVAPEDISVPA